jgi:hypothetical protein
MTLISAGKCKTEKNNFLLFVIIIMSHYALGTTFVDNFNSFASNYEKHRVAYNKES